MSRAGSPGGRFDARYEAHSVSAGAKDDLEQPFGQAVDWWVYDVAHQQIDSIYDVGVPEVGGRTWKGPYHLPVISAHQLQGRTPQQQHEGFFNADRLRLVIRVDTARQVGVKHIADRPDLLLHDRVVWRGEVFQPESAQPRGIIGHDRYLIVGIDATQIRPDELLNDPSFPNYYPTAPVDSGLINLRAHSSVAAGASSHRPLLKGAYGAGVYGAGPYGGSDNTYGSGRYGTGLYGGVDYSYGAGVFGGDEPFGGDLRSFGSRFFGSEPYGN